MPPDFVPYHDSLRLAAGDFVHGHEVGALLGQGRFSEVYASRCDGEPAALKVMRKGYSGKGVRSERRALRATAGRKRVVGLIDAFEERGHDVLVLPRVGQNLYEVLEMRYEFRQLGLVEGDLGLPLPLCQKLAADILLAVAELHNAGYMHSDLKPENIALSRAFSGATELYEADPTTWCCVLVDLGSAFPHDSNEGFSIGTSTYRSPELTIQSSPYSQMIDMWSAACVIYELRTRCSLFDCSHDEDDIMATMTDSGTSSDGDGGGGGGGEEEEDAADERDPTDSSDEDMQQNITDFAMTRVFQRVCGRFPGGMVKRARLGRMLFNRRGFVRDMPPPVRRDDAEPGILETLADFSTMSDAEKVALSRALAPLVKLSPNLRSAGAHFAASDWATFAP